MHIDQATIDEGMRHLEATYPHPTLCNVLREIHHTSGDPRITELCCQAIVYAKKIARRLEEYSQAEHARWAENGQQMPPEG